VPLALPENEPIGVCFSGGIDSGAVFLTTYHVMRKLGLNLSRLKAFTLSFGNGDNATFAYSVTLGSPAVTVAQTKQLSRLVFRDPGTVCR